MTSEGFDQQVRILTSWKDIANYLGKGVRTVQRWEADMGLPVLRPDGHENKVLARCSEIDAWLRSNWVQRKPHRLQMNGSGTAELDGARVNCSSLRQKQRTLRGELHATVIALQESCSELMRTFNSTGGSSLIAEKREPRPEIQKDGPSILSKSA